MSIKKESAKRRTINDRTRMLSIGKEFRLVMGPEPDDIIVMYSDTSIEIGTTDQYKGKPIPYKACALAHTRIHSGSRQNSLDNGRFP